MRKLIAAINMTLDGYCDHTAGIADDELHQHYNELLESSGALLYGRITYQMMESYWPTVVKNPTGDKPIDDFAVLIDNIPKIVFSKTLESAPWGDGSDWEDARIVKTTAVKELAKLKRRPGKNMVIWGSISLAQSLIKADLIDEYRLVICPVVLGSGRMDQRFYIFRKTAPAISNARKQESFPDAGV